MAETWAMDPMRGVGWTVLDLKAFIESRPWAAIEYFYRDLVRGAADISAVGLHLVESPRHDVHAAASAGVHNAAAARPSPPAEAEQPMDSSSSSSQPGTGRRAQKRALRGERQTFRVAVSYFGPAFQGWKWQKDVRGTLEEGIAAALSAVNSKAAAAGAQVRQPCAGVCW